MNAFSFIVAFSTLLHVAQAATHWRVTDDGRIRQQTETLFTLKRPHDLVAVMRHEEEADNLTSLRSDLIRRKKQIDSKQHLYEDDDDVTSEEAFRRRDRECLLAGKPLHDIDLFVSTVLPLEVKGISTVQHLGSVSSSSSSREPDCTRVSRLDFSVHAYEHLEGVSKRASLPHAPEMGLRSAVPESKNVSAFASRIASGLNKNRTSWVLYNLAAFYWRIKGNGRMAVECLRRALEYSPRKYKDVALVSLGNILHRGQHSDDAAVVVAAAVDVSPQFHVSHFTLGNIYAVTSDYDQAALCFEHTTRIFPEFRSAHQRLHAVRCQRNLERTLETQQRILEDALEELESYQKDFDAFHERHQAFLGRMVSQREHDKQSEVYALFKSTKGKKTKEKTSTETKPTLSKRDVDDVKPVTKPSPALSVSKTKGERVSVSKDDVVTENDIVNAKDDDDDVSKETVPSDDEESPSNEEKSSPSNGEKTPPPRFRLRVVKMNESDDNSPRTIKIEVADENGRFPGNEKTPDEETDKQASDFIEEYELTIRPDGTVANDDDDEEEKKRIPDDETIWNRVVGRTKTGGAILDTGEVLENKHAPRIVVESATETLCESERGSKTRTCLHTPEEEKVDYAMRLRIEKLEAPLGRAVNRPLSFGMIYASKRRTLTFIETRNVRYRLPRKRLLDDLVAIYPTVDYMPNFDARPRLAPVYASQRRVNESRDEARRRRRRVQERVERVPAMFRVPDGATYDRIEAKLTVHLRTDVFVPTQKACEEYFQYLPSIDDYPSAYLPIEARGGNSTRVLSLGLLPGTMHHAPWTDPVCVDYGDDPSPLHAFDHLIGIQYRDRLSFLPEPQMKPILTGMLDADAPLQEVGQRIRTAFEAAIARNDTNDFWVLFNLAGLFFRVIGNPYHAIECLRRALHYSPYETKDVALVQLANVLRRVGHLTDAARVTQAALAIHPFEPLTHFTLATIYGAKGRRNDGGVHASFCVDMIPDFRLARRLVQALFCSELFPHEEKRWHAQLRDDLRKRQASEGKEPTGRPEFVCTMSTCDIPRSPMTKSFGAVTTTATPVAPYDLPEFVYATNPAMKPYQMRWEREDARRREDERGVARVRAPAPDEPAVRILPEEILLFRDPNAPASADVPPLSMRGQPAPMILSASPPYVDPAAPADAKRHLNIIRWAVNDFSPVPVKSDGTFKVVGVDAKHPHAGKVVAYKIWPSLSSCLESDLVNVRTPLSTWISPEMKGIDIRRYIDFEEIFNTARLWPMPMCKYDVPNNPYTMDHLLGMQYRQQLHIYNYTAEVGLLPVLKSISGSQDVRLDEIAIRLDMALAKNASSWIIADLASLYWRVLGNASQAMQCLRVSLYLAPRHYRHFALTGLANIFIKTGFYDDAITVLQLSNEIAPEVIMNHFLMANALSMMGYYEDAVLYYESALLHQPDFPPAQCRLRTTRCMLMLRYIMQLNRDLMKGVVGVKRTKSRGEKMKIVDKAVIDWLMEDKPFPLEQKALCVFSGGNERYC